MSRTDFSEPRNQEILGVVILFFSNARKYANVLLALIFGSIFSGTLTIWIGVVFIVGLVLMGVLSWFQYKRFLFHVDDESLRIQEGVFVKENITIPFDRIQSVHLHQNIVQQVIGLTGVKVDTAGSGKKELEIHALTKEDALALQEILQRKREMLVESERVEEKGERVEGKGEKAKGKGEEKRTLVRLSIGQLLMVGLTQNHIRNGFVVVAAIFGYFWQLEEYLEGYFDSVSEEVVNTITTSWMIMSIIVLVVFLIGSVIISVVQVFLKYFNLNAFLTSKSLHVNAGLLKRNEYTIPLKKIQIVEWYSNFLRKIPGFESAKIYQAQSQERGKGTVEIPACFDKQTADIMDSLFPTGENTTAFSDYRVHPFYRTFLYFVLGLIPFLAVSVLWFVTGETLFLIGYGIYLLIMAPWVAKYVRSVKISTNGDVLIYSRGWLFTRRTVMRSFKIQSVEFHQNFFQRRRKTAHLTLYTAGGSRTIRFVEEQLAREFYNYFIYRAETHKGSWM